MRADKILQLLHLCLHFGRGRVFGLHGAKHREDRHQLAAHIGGFFYGFVGGLFFIFFVFRRGTPLLFGLGSIVLDFLRIKCGKVHN